MATASAGWEFELAGGHPALDLVNTVAWRLDPARTVDRISGFSSLARWSAAAGLIAPDVETDLLQQAAARPDRAQEALREARAIREAVHGVAGAVADGREPGEHHLNTVHRMLARAIGRAEIASVVPWRWTLRPRAPADLPWAIALAAGRLFQEEDLTRLRRCHDAGCGWLFLDRSRNGSRRWCSSADCGNRARARRHYERHRTS
ncbi:CGNR zinc finger domain-containing protein [Amycolatopsis pigmentata]|uniref:CGNR zinc finger domain-containing protein n=1 Tax=Amycolatopsis pigmentata TaxID=450801 RepID=A0ABW5G2U6_9PSEU